MISSFEEYLKKRERFDIDYGKFSLESIDEKVCKDIWNKFYLLRRKQEK